MLTHYTSIITVSMLMLTWLWTLCYVIERPRLTVKESDLLSLVFYQCNLMAVNR